MIEYVDIPLEQRIGMFIAWCFWYNVGLYIARLAIKDIKSKFNKGEYGE